MIAEQSTRDFRVSVRELREESYRALRSKGYNWGHAQTASRIASQSQVLWGTGLQSIEHECSRFIGKNRLPVSDGREKIKNRGSSFAIWGPIVASVAISHSESVVEVGGVSCLQEFATGFWDLENTSPWTWEDGNGCKFGLDAEGNLYGTVSKSGKKVRLSVWQGFQQSTEYQLLLPFELRKQKLRLSLSEGVVVDADRWFALKKYSWKFLVPE